jgi:signal transduction histidine kinase
MIVREIVEAHGGSVGVESRVGIGSRFWIRLPSASGPTASPAS